MDENEDLNTASWVIGAVLLGTGVITVVIAMIIR